MSAPTVVSGIRGTGQLNTESRRTRDVAKAMSKLEPNAGPLLTLLQRVEGKAQVSKDPKFEWYEDQLLPRFDTLGGALTAGATTMTVSNYVYFRKGDIVVVNNKERVRVTVTPSTTTVSISRAAGETSAQAADSGAKLHIIGNGNEEGALSRSLISTQKVPQYNYCQIFRTPFGVTETANVTDTFGGKDMDEERANSLIEHKKDIELSLWFGERKEDTSGTHPLRLTRGAIKFISTNVKDVAALTEQEFEDFLRICFRYGSREKVLFCSPKLIQVINGFSRGRLETKSDESTYGVTVTRFQNAGRKVMLVEHHLFTNDNLSDLSGIAGYGALLDIGDLRLRYMSGRMAVLKPNIQANDEDSRKDEYLSEVGLEMKQELKHGLLTGVQQ